MGAKSLWGAAVACALFAGSAHAARTGTAGHHDRYWIEAQSSRLHAEKSTLSRIAKAALPAVVSITTEQDPDPADAGKPGGDEPQKGLGSGFIIHPEGYVLTSSHVIEGARSIEVSVIDRRGQTTDYDATVVGQDAQTDIALLKIQADRRFPTLKLGTAKDVDTADWVVAIGNPFGLSWSVSVGVVSYKGRTDVTPSGRSGDFDYLQTDAAINPGNSGGPILDLNGEVVAIANAVNVSGQGIGFAVPIDTAKDILPQLYAHGSVRRGWMGVSVEDLTQSAARRAGVRREPGVLVSELIEDSPAAKAGLEVGDVIIGVNRHRVDRAHELRWSVAIAGSGTPMELAVRRNGRLMKLKVRLAEPPALDEPPEEIVARAPQRSLGADLEDEAVRSSSRQSAPRGARVRSVDPEGALGRAGVAAGDLVTQLNHTEVGSREELLQRFADLAPGAQVMLSLRRGGTSFEVSFQKP